MGGTSFVLDWGGLDIMVKNSIAKARKNQTVLGKIGEAMRSSTVERFSLGETPEGKSWTPSQRALKEDGQTLVNKEALRKSIVFETTSDRVVWGSNEEYARIHQLGGETGRNHAVTIEARPYIGLSSDDEEEILDILKKHMLLVLDE